MKRFVWLGFVLVVYLICSGCGDTFRPIIIPNPPKFPNPAAAHTVVSINDNGAVVSGTAMVIDVSGDTDVSVRSVGLNPVHAVQQTANQILVVNQSNVNLPQDSVTKLIFSGTVIGNVTSITLPASYDPAPPHNLTTSLPNFVATTESSQAYVTMPNYQPNPNGAGTNPITPSVAVIDTLTNQVIAMMSVGDDPLAMAETPNGQKLYVADNGDNTIDGFNTSDRSSRTIVGSFNAPLWLSARNDSQRVYVLNGNGVVSTIDTTSTAGPDNVIDASVNAPGAYYMFYDMNANRLYLPGVNQNQLMILDVSQPIPVVLTGAPISIPTVAPSSRGATDPCSSTAQTALTVVSVAALPDGSRAYVGAYYTDSNDNICPQVTVIDAVSNTVKSTTAVPGFPDATNPSSQYYVPVCTTTRFRFTMAAGGDSSRAYLASCDGGMVNIIDTSVDSYTLNLPEPVGTRAPIPPNPQNPPQNPVFLLAGP